MKTKKPTKITAQKRARQFPERGLSVKNEKLLWCTLCSKQVSFLRTEAIKCHLSSAKHIRNERKQQQQSTFNSSTAPASDFMELNGYCLFCLETCESRHQNLNEDLRHLLFSTNGEFKRFFWKALIGKDANVNSSSEGGNANQYNAVSLHNALRSVKLPTEMQICSVCNEKLEQIKTLHSNLETIQMLVVDKVKNLQQLVYNAKETRLNSWANDNLLFNPDKISQLEQFQEEVISHSQSIRPIPLVYIDSMSKTLPVSLISPSTPVEAEFMDEWDDNSNIEVEDCLNEVVIKEEVDSDSNDEMEVAVSDCDKNTNNNTDPDPEWIPDPKEDQDDEDYQLSEPFLLKKKRKKKKKVVPPKRITIKRYIPKHGKDALEKYKLKMAKKLKKEQLKLMKSREFSNHTVFRCEICNEVYFRRPAFLRHKLSHLENADENELVSNEELHQESSRKIETTVLVYGMKECSFCKKSVNLSDYYEHLLLHENEPTVTENAGTDETSVERDGQLKKLSCAHEGCEVSFRIEENLKIHKEIDHPERGFLETMQLVKKCDICNICFDSNNTVADHMRKLHKGHPLYHSRLRCRLCNYIVISQEKMVIHSYTHAASDAMNQNICFMCYDKFDNHPELLEHFSTAHSIQTSVNCNICNEYFVDFLRYKIHLQTVHKQTEKFICNFCGEICYFPSSFLAHFKIHKTIDKNTFPCSDCSEKFMNEDKLSQHRVKVHNAKKHSCEICLREYMTPKALKHHLKEHSKEGFHCEVCDKYFGNKGRFQIHLTMHSDERPFTCEVCGLSFKNKWVMRRHFSTHEKKHVCEVCGRRFSRLREKTNHMHLHTGVTFLCSHCGYQVHSTRSLKRHVVKYHTSDNPLPLYRPQKVRKPYVRWKDTDGNVYRAQKLAEPSLESQSEIKDDTCVAADNEYISNVTNLETFLPIQIDGQNFNETCCSGSSNFLSN